MIIKGTRILVSDNSVAQIIQVINPYNQTKLGNIVKVTIKKSKGRKRVSPGVLCYAVITQVKSRHARKDGSALKFDNNRCILLDNKQLPIASKLTGFSTHELRIKKMTKIVSLTRYCF